MSSGRGGGGSRRGAASGSVRAGTSRAVSELGAFGASVAAQGLGRTLDSLGLGELRGRPAVEVVALLAEHLSSHADGLDRVLLTGALRDTILEVSSLDDSVGYQDLEEALESFLDANGVEGLIESFLANLVYDQIWSLVEQWILEKSESNHDIEALRSSVENACRQLVREAMDDPQKNARFDSVDWFGSDGIALARRVIQDVENRLNGAADEEV